MKALRAAWYTLLFFAFVAVSIGLAWFIVECGPVAVLVFLVVATYVLAYALTD